MSPLQPFAGHRDRHSSASWRHGGTGSLASGKRSSLQIPPVVVAAKASSSRFMEYVAGRAGTARRCGV
ncbi:hypothetical protein FE633_20345 [Streptomyces montanus]|uniref:Uncharacterized protein n=1 Tax=Streptomyces montanus TaxID=2580423 RepID=A0A5R9FSM2_9ACTN|nr:hypothetical protein [Streptomyces montanus]TLS44378.1 hypothetical protein FE633_20345 [Streptomyces montanus]